MPLPLIPLIKVFVGGIILGVLSYKSLDTAYEYGVKEGLRRATGKKPIKFAENKKLLRELRKMGMTIPDTVNLLLNAKYGNIAEIKKDAQKFMASKSKESKKRTKIKKS